MGHGCNSLGWGHWMGWGGGWGSLLLNLAFSVGVLVLFGLAAAWLARQLRRRPVATGVREEPLQLAQRRLAAGEITISEYEEIRDRLER